MVVVKQRPGQPRRGRVTDAGRVDVAFALAPAKVLATGTGRADEVDLYALALADIGDPQIAAGTALVEPDIAAWQLAGNSADKAVLRQRAEAAGAAAATMIGPPTRVPPTRVPFARPVDLRTAPKPFCRRRDLKLQMAKNSLFAVLLRSPWWVSLAIAAGIGVAAMALLPPAWRGVALFSGFPFVVLSAMAAWKQWHVPGAARVEQTRQAVAAMAWPAFSRLLEDAFKRDGYSVQRGSGEVVDFVLERKGRRMLVSARRWKSARLGLETMRALQAAREAAEAPDALCIGLGALTDTARPFAAEHRVAVWQAPEIAQALRGVRLAP